MYTVQCTQNTWSNCAESHQQHARSHQLCTMNGRGHINFVSWMHAVTSTTYHEWKRGHTNSLPWMHAVCWLRQVTFIQFNQKIFWTNCVHSWYGVCVTAFIHGTELMRFGEVTLGRTKISIQWLWPVKVTLKVIKRRLMVFCWSCDEGPLKKDLKKTSEPPVYQWGSNENTLDPPPKWSVNAFNYTFQSVSQKELVEEQERKWCRKLAKQYI